MRAPLSSLFAALVLAGCVSGTRTIVVREYPAATPAPTPAPKPVPVPLPAPRRLMQLEVALGNPSAGKVPVQTNRAAYVAIFEIVPKQGVTLLHPSTARQGRTVVSGLSWVPVGPLTSPASRPAGNSGRAQRSVRYIYALASDTPIRIPERALEPGYLEQLLGPASYRAASPQAAVRALSREFAPKLSDEQWAEDLYAVESSDNTAPPRIARIYCGNGRVYEVPEDIADRAWCPERNPSPGVTPTPARPDSVVGGNGRRIGPRVPEKAGRVANLPSRRPEHPAHPAHPGKPEHPSTPRNEKAEKEKAEKDRADKEKADKDKADKAEKDRVEKEKAEKEKADKAEKERVEKEKADKAEKDRVEKEKADKAEKERVEKEKADKAEKERVEKEKADKAEKERADKEKADKDKADKDKADKDKADKDKADKSGKDESDSAADSDTTAGKPDESDKGKKDSGPAREANERKGPEKSKNAPKADSTRNVGSRGTPNRGRTSP